MPTDTDSIGKCVLMIRPMPLVCVPIRLLCALNTSMRHLAAKALINVLELSQLLYRILKLALRRNIDFYFDHLII